MLAAAILILAAGPALDGRWTPLGYPSLCGRSSQEPDAPTVIRGRRLSQYEAECRWGAPRRAGLGAWTAAGACTAEGDTARGRVRLRLRGDVLSFTDPNGVTQRLRRCR